MAEEKTKSIDLSVPHTLSHTNPHGAVFWRSDGKIVDVEEAALPVAGLSDSSLTRLQAKEPGLASRFTSGAHFRWLVNPDSPWTRHEVAEVMIRIPTK